MENIAERGRPHMTIWRIRIAWWIPKATNRHTVYVILIAFPTATVVALTRVNVTL